MSINPALDAADRSLELELKRKITIGHLRSVARDIAFNLYGVTIETAEVITLQDFFEKTLDQFMNAMRSPGASLIYTAPDQVRGRITAQTESVKEVEGE